VRLRRPGSSSKLAWPRDVDARESLLLEPGRVRQGPIAALGDQRKVVLILERCQKAPHQLGPRMLSQPKSFQGLARAATDQSHGLHPRFSQSRAR